MNKNNWNLMNEKMMAQGYEIKEKIRLPYDSGYEDGYCCPMCNVGGYGRTLYALPDNPKRTIWVDHCYTCKHIWSE